MPDTAAVVLYDGSCGICNAFVQFVIDHDPHALFRFAPLTGATASRQLARLDEPGRRMIAGGRSVVLVEGVHIYFRSTAALRILRRLGGAWPLAYILVIVPRPVRDAVYDWVADSRHRWSGPAPSCVIPTADVAARFLD